MVENYYGRINFVKAMIKLRNKFGPIEFTTYLLVTEKEVELWTRAQLDSQRSFYGLDIETAKQPKFLYHSQAGLDPILTLIRLIQVYDGESTYVIDLWKTPGAWETLKPFFRSKTFVAHNAKFELKHFTYNGIPDIDLHCSFIMSSLTHKAEHPQFEKVQEIPGDEVFDEDGDGLSQYRFVGHSLDAVVGRLYKIKIPKHLQVSDWNAPELTQEQLLYAGLDALLTYRAFCDLYKVAEDNDILRAYELTRQLQYPIAEMEIEGFPVDWESHKTLVANWNEDLEDLRPLIERWFGSCNLNSGKQKAEWLEWYLRASGQGDQLASWPTTKTGALSFSKGTLVEYAHLPPIELLLNYSKLDKLRNTYGESLVDHKHPVTKCLHTGFKLASTQTGRLASAKPNLQNMPRGKEMRSIFRAPQGYRLVVGDLSQIEMRVAAELSNDTTLKYCFKNQVDTHRLVVNSVFGTPIDQVTKNERQFGKAINFGLMFGMGATKLIKYAKLNYGVELDEQLAWQGINAFRSLYTGLINWSDNQRACAETLGYCTTPLGEKRALAVDDVYTKSVNTPVQGGAGEVLKLGIVYIWKALRQRNMESVLVTTVHDETAILAPISEAEDAREILEQSKIRAMQELFPEAPLENLIEAGIGETWATAKP